MREPGEWLPDRPDPDGVWLHCSDVGKVPQAWTAGGGGALPGAGSPSLSDPVQGLWSGLDYAAPGYGAAPGAGAFVTTPAVGLWSSTVPVGGSVTTPPVGESVPTVPVGASGLLLAIAVSFLLVWSIA